MPLVVFVKTKTIVTLGLRVRYVMKMEHAARLIAQILTAPLRMWVRVTVGEGGSAIILVAFIVTSQLRLELADNVQLGSNIFGGLQFA